MIQGIFFDHGGTLAHAPAAEVTLGKILRSLGRDFEPAVLSEAAARFGQHWDAKYSSLPRGRRWSLEIRRDCDRAALAVLGLGDALDLVAAQVTDAWDRVEKTELYDDALPVLEALKARGLRMGVISQRLDRVEEFVPRLEALGVAGYFPVVVTSEEGGFDKPDPRLYLGAAVRMGLKPSQLCHVGDSYAMDVAGARGAGIWPILIDREGKDDRGDCTVVRSLTEIPTLLGSLG